MRTQPRGFERKQVSARLKREISREVEKQATRFKCSKSFVIAVALAETFGIKLSDLEKLQ